MGKQGNEERIRKTFTTCNKTQPLVIKSKEKVCWNSQNARVKVKLNNDKSNEKRKALRNNDFPTHKHE